MSHHQANRIRAKLAPFMSFLSVITLFFILASCGRDAQADTKNIIYGKTITIGTKENPIQIKMPDLEFYHGKKVVARQIILSNVYNKSEKEMNEFILEHHWELINQSGITYQINIGVDDIEQTIKKIRSLKIGAAMPNFIPSLNGNGSVNDPYSTLDANYGWALNSIKVREAWKYVPDNIGPLVGIIDGGFKFNHEDLGFTRIAGKEYDTADQTHNFESFCDVSNDGPNAPVKDTSCDLATHGMNVAGIISGTGNNRKGIAGVAWMSGMAPIAYQFTDGETVELGISWMIDQKAKIVNMSLGYPHEDNEEKDYDLYEEDVNAFLRKLKLKYPLFPNVLFVQSAGNEGTYHFKDGTPIFSAYNGRFAAIADNLFKIDDELKDYANEVKKHILIVGAFNKNRDISAFTSLPSPNGNTSYILAPGGSGGTKYIDFLSNLLALNVAGPAFSANNRYVAIGGTSQAAPHVSGVAALVLQTNPTLLATEVRDIILLNSDEIISDNVTYRALNAEKAVMTAAYKPFASFSIGDTAPRPFDTVTFTPTASSENGAIIALEWDFGDGSATQIVANRIAVMHTYVIPGTYTVKLKVKDSKGSVNTTVQLITVSDTARTPRITKVTPQIVTPGQIQEFEIAGSDLPQNEPLNITFKGCPNISYQSSTVNRHKFTCVPQTIGKLTLEVRITAGGDILKSQAISVASIGSPPVGIWMGWNGSKFTAEEVVQKPGYITKATSNWSTLRLRLSNTINGDNFSVEFRAKNDPALGGQYYRDMGFSLGNDMSTGLYDNAGNPRGTRQVTFLTRNGYSNDFFVVNSTAGDSGYIYQPGVVDNSIWHKYKLTVKNNTVTLHYDDVLRYSQPFSGNIGALDVFYIWGLMNVELDTASMKFSTPPAPVVIEIPATTYINGENVALSANDYGTDTLMNAPPYTEATNAAEWMINIPTAGTYELFSDYAAALSRPTVISFNGAVAFPNALTPTTGGWFPANRQVLSEGTVSLPAGTVRMRAARNSVFPHIHGFRLVKRD